MSELIQDVQFFEGEPEADRVRKLRILQDELSRLGRLSNVISVREDGALELGQLAVVTAAGAAPLGYITATVNDIPVRLAILPPA
jgi:hypothetical protein